MAVRFLILSIILVCAFAALAEAAPASSLVFVGADGKLQYTADADGDKIMDYSEAGYQNGTQNIPLVPAVITLNSTGTSADDTARIQAAINQLAAMPLVNGFHGAIQFGPGTFNIASGLNINASGIVLRGAGQSPTGGTLFHATGNADGTASYDVITAKPTGSQSYSAVAGTTETISDSYVPVGATSFTVPNANIYHVGDKIIVDRPSTQKWIDDIGMGAAAAPAGLGTEHWNPSSSFMQADRTITAINGNTITIDAGLTTALDSRTIGGVANAYGGGTIFKYTTNRITNVGIENIRFDTIAVPGSTDMNHAGRPVTFNGVMNAWVRNTTTLGYYNGAFAGSKSENVTFVDNEFRDPAGDTHSGGHAMASQYSLIERSSTFNSHAPFVTQDSNTIGPDVFAFDTAIGSLQSVGPHQRWASGVLWDNIKVTGNAGIELVNRGNDGSGQGWAGANMVTWNSQAPWSDVEMPPTAQNWAIGTITPNKKSNTLQGIYDQFGTRVTPNSLYIAQLKQALPTPAAPNVVRSYMVGDDDNFQLNSSADFPFVDPAWKSIVETDLPGTGTVQAFDDTITNARHAATILYSLGGGEKVVSAILTMKLKALSTISGTDSFFLDSPGMELDYDMLGLTSPSWNTGTVKTVTIDLSDIFGPLLSPLQNGQLSDGMFNLSWNGNVAIDFVQLDLGIVPEPSSLALLVSGALGVGALMRRGVRRAR